MVKFVCRFFIVTICLLFVCSCGSQNREKRRHTGMLCTSVTFIAGLIHIDDLVIGGIVHVAINKYISGSMYMCVCVCACAHVYNPWLR